MTMTNVMPDQTPSNAPMSAAPMQYNADGSVAWGDMWTTFCTLAQDGGPPHRGDGDAIPAQTNVNPNDSNYSFAVSEICRGIRETTGLEAHAGEIGWIAVQCPIVGQAQWLAGAIRLENVAARHDDLTVFVPVSHIFTLKGEIKSVITVVAKTVHYWNDHLPPQVKQSYAIQAKLGGWKRKLFGKK